MTDFCHRENQRHKPPHCGNRAGLLIAQGLLCANPEVALFMVMNEKRLLA